MAVHCGVCGVQIGSAPDNYGSFSVTEDFKGWDHRGLEGFADRCSPCIRDTCKRCCTVLTKVVTDAANKIVEKNKARVQILRDEMQRLADREARMKKDRVDFEREWEARRRSGR